MLSLCMHEGGASHPASAAAATSATGFLPLGPSPPLPSPPLPPPPPCDPPSPPPDAAIKARAGSAGTSAAVPAKTQHAYSALCFVKDQFLSLCCSELSSWDWARRQRRCCACRCCLWGAWR